MPDLQKWPPGTSDAIGQAGEFLVWAALITQSGGGLHIFLPAHDRGIDGLVHRLHDRAYLALQVSEVLPSIADTSGPYYELHFRPDGSSEPSRLDVYRIKLENLATEVANLL